MGTLTRRSTGLQNLIEMQEFASFSSGTQRYIRRSLACSGDRAALAGLARNSSEAASISKQLSAYYGLEKLKLLIPSGDEVGLIGPFMSSLIVLTAFDLSEKRLPSFASYRFLYERLLGASVRPWLLPAFCATAMLPSLHPSLRLTLLQSVDPVAASSPGWSIREPVFFPQWIEKEHA